MSEDVRHVVLAGTAFGYRDTRRGLPVVFQHGLGADAGQPADVMPERPRVRAVTLECRGHGRSAPAASPSIAGFARDVRALIGYLGLDRPVVGGISMGAAVALRLAAETPDAFRALVIARPAWEIETAPANMRIFAEAARALGEHGPVAGRERFAASAAARGLGEASPDNLASVLGQFDHPDPAGRAALLAAVASDGPGVDAAAVAALDLPTLVIGNADDAIHPLPMARALAERIRGARFVEIPSKTRSREGYRAGFRAALAGFLSPFAAEEAW